MRLSRATLAGLPPTVGRPAYDLDAVRIGVVHLGSGAFFRAHAAAYLDAVLARDPRWGVCAVALRSTEVRDALAPQDGLYTLAELGAHTRLRVLGPLRELLSAAETPERVRARLRDPGVRLVTLTVTEKGYGLDAEGRLDAHDPAVAHDLAQADAPRRSVAGWLAQAFADRRADGAPPLTVLSCDNLVDNGLKLGRATARFAALAGDAGLAAHVEAAGRFPRSMVDSITPATTDALRRRVAETLGVEDAWPVQREPFVQWVVEDALGRDAPDLAAVGVTLARDVRPFEQAKLRLLNGAHSTLAYLGRLAGLETVAEAMAEPRLGRFVERLMRDTIAPTLSSSELDVARYIDDVLARFRNPGLRHELAQIAWDGSKKLPVRLLGTAADVLAAGGDLRPIALPVAAWMRFVRAETEAGRVLTDPSAESLAARLGDGGPGEVRAFLALREVFPAPLAEAPPFREVVLAAHAALARDPLGALA